MCTVLCPDIYVDHSVLFFVMDRHDPLTRELTNRRLLPDAAVRLRDMLTAHAFLSTCELRANGDDLGESDLAASWKQEDVSLVFKVFSQSFGYFYQII